MTTNRPQTSPQVPMMLSSPRLHAADLRGKPVTPLRTSLQDVYASTTTRHFYVLGFRAPLALFKRETRTGLITSKSSDEAFNSKQYLLKLLARKKNSLLSSVERTEDTPSSSHRKETLEAKLPPPSPLLKPTNSVLNLRVADSLRVTGISTPRVIQEKVPLKEACKDREWVLQAREQLVKDWSQCLRLSNGVKTEASAQGYLAYTYYLGKGNNHPLVNSCFRNRGWVQLQGEDGYNEAHVVWTQAKMEELYQYYPTVDSRNHRQVAGSMTLLCTVKLNSKYRSSKGKYVDICRLGYGLITQSPSFSQLTPTLTLDPQLLETHNKLEFNDHLTNKKSLYFTLKTYCNLLNIDLFRIIPVTYHIVNGENDSEFERFIHENAYLDANSQEVRLNGVWIVKPGENTNRGTGIAVVSTVSQLQKEFNYRPNGAVAGGKRTFIVQKYLETPLLLNRRKFDIRCYVLITSINSVVQAYFYQEGYLRTSSKEFTLKDLNNKFVHLTNDAVQKFAEDYGKYEAGNKLSYVDFQRFLDANVPGISVNRDIITQIREIVKMTIEASYMKLDRKNHQYTFEVLGYDFMVDTTLKAWLIEVNTNPCLETSSPLLSRLIPAMLDNAFRIAIDPYYPDFALSTSRKSPILPKDPIPENRFELIFSSTCDGLLLQNRLGSQSHRLIA